MVAYLCVTLGFVAGTVYLLGILATRHHFGPRPHGTERRPLLPAVSLLKPLRGLEEALEDNLRTFFTQDYPDFELVFATADADDPALAVARRVAVEYPHVPARFVRSDPGFGLNPKVANLRGALLAASHDLVHQSDGNVRIAPGYLRQVVTELLDERASLLTSVVVGTGERSLGAALENLQLSALIAPSVCAALHFGGVTCVIGKSMLFRRSELEAVGGLEAVRDVLCEDFVLGKRYEAAGHRVILSKTRVENVNIDGGVGRFLERHSRWLKMRAVIHRPGFAADLLTSPVPHLLLAFAASGFRVGFGVLFLAGAAAKMAGDLFLVRTARGYGVHPAVLLLVPLRDILMVLVWCYSAVSRTVRWRGQRLSFGKGSVITGRGAAATPLARDAGDARLAPRSGTP